MIDTYKQATARITPAASFAGYTWACGCASERQTVERFRIYGRTDSMMHERAVDGEWETKPCERHREG